MKHSKYIYKLRANGIQNEVCCDELKLAVLKKLKHLHVIEYGK